MSFTDKLKLLLQNKGVTAKQFLSDLGLNRNSMCDWRKHNNFPPSGTLKRIAEYFSVTTDYFFAEENLPTTFGERVKQARLAKGLTQSQLAKCARYAGATSIASLETQGRCNAAAEKIVNLCKVLDTDPNTILGWNDENKTFKVKVRRK